MQERTNELLAEVLTALQAIGRAHVPEPTDMVASILENRVLREPESTRPWERAAETYMERLAGLPDVEELLLFDMGTIGVSAGGPLVYADIAVTDADGGRWLAEVKRRPGSKPFRAARAGLLQETLDAADAGWRWAVVTPAAAEKATSWRQIVSA